MTLAHHTSGDHERLRRKAAYFFASSTDGRSEVSAFARRLSEVGRTAVIGGFLRDLCLAGTRRFASDVDFVVHPESLTEFDKLIQRLGAQAKVNRFGGYAVSLGHWKVDVWALQRTWAGAEGYRAVQSLEDCLTTTFFDWDAALFFVDSNSLATKDDYFERLNGRILGINLEPNPNPLGNAVRALRYAHLWRAQLDRSLSSFVLAQIVDVGWSRLLSYEASSFQNTYLQYLEAAEVCTELARVTQAANESASASLNSVASGKAVPAHE